MPRVQATFAEAGWVMIGAIILILLFRSILQRATHEKGEHSVVDTVIEPLAGIYGLLLAILVGGAVDRASELQQGLEMERAAYVRVSEIAARMPAGVSKVLQPSLRRYAQLENAAGLEEQPSPASKKLLNEIWFMLAEFEPARPSEVLLQSEALDAIHTLAEHRIFAARANRFPNKVLVWMILIVGSVSVLGVCALASLGDPRGRIYLTALTAVVAITLYVFFALTRPIAVAPFLE
jgi:hypothetical protein